jgi:DNA (cytosine-5)-methyltransferase 1
MRSDTYLSIFSGIGGLEHPTRSPLIFCEQDSACQEILRGTHPDVPIFSDVRSLHDPPQAGLVVGGWPCQDISSAGNLGGISASRSGLFFEMLRVAKCASAHTLIGENVPNLLTINKGADFRLILDTISGEGYPYIGWRVLNARQFGLPQQRRRLFVVASRHKEHAEGIHSQVPRLQNESASRGVFAFYWTGGKRSICMSNGYAPAIKIGATDNKGRAPVAILLGDHIRKLSSRECLRLQGFDGLSDMHPGVPSSTLLRMAGNAVPRPMGHFVVRTVSNSEPSDGMRTAFGIISDAGFYERGQVWTITHSENSLASNLSDFLDLDRMDRLSGQAAAGLLVRSVRAQQPMPVELFDILCKLAARRSAKLRPSRANSFEALDAMVDDIAQYRANLVPIAQYFAPVSGDQQIG